MGQSYAFIYPVGDAFRCCTLCPTALEGKGKLGNLLEGNFAFFKDATLCGYNTYEFPNAMIVGEEENWQHYWSHRGMYAKEQQ